MSTICAIATAPGGAIGIVRISGPESITIASTIFTGKKPLTEAQPYSIHYGKIIDGHNILDEVLVSVFKAPNSYTGEDSIEIACHGSNYILQRLVQLLIDQGCTMATAGEFTMRAFANGKMDLSQAEAVADLIAADSKAAHQVAFNQMRGGISQRLADLRLQLLNMASLLELELDFSEEDVEFANREQLLALATDIQSEISKMSNTFASGNALKNGVPVAIIGAPNVGKSTLLNALLRDNRAIVSDIKGTTRDIIEDTITLQGILFRFIDTAGLHTTDDTIEKIGIERSLQAIERAHIILLVTEPGVPYPDITIREGQIIIHILNKSDDFQAINGTGLSQLEQQLVDSVPQVSDNTILITNLRHKEALDLALQSITIAINNIKTNCTGDLIAEDLRQCLTHLSEIVGEVSSPDILKNIFKNFCIGK